MESYTEAEFEKFFSSGTTPPPILELQAKAKLLLDTATADRQRKFKRGAVMCRRALALVEKYRKEETRGRSARHLPPYTANGTGERAVINNRATAAAICPGTGN
jgi:hypothetical protein